MAKKLKFQKMPKLIFMLQSDETDINERVEIFRKFKTSMAVLSKKILKHIRSLEDPVIAEHSKRFFKTGAGEYGEGDKFLGIRVPAIRKLINQYQEISLEEINIILESEYHEERLFALLMLVKIFTKGNEKKKTQIYNLYLQNTKHINNWDLVDSSASQIVGDYLENRDKKILYELAESQNLWERRISIISTFHLIRNNHFSDILNIAKILKQDKEDLIHKAVGWMLREVGNRNIEIEKNYLKRHYKNMPRTMLRYAIEKFPETERKAYLFG